MYPIPAACHGCALGFRFRRLGIMAARYCAVMDAAAGVIRLGSPVQHCMPWYSSSLVTITECLRPGGMHGWCGRRASGIPGEGQALPMIVREHLAERDGIGRGRDPRRIVLLSAVLGGVVGLSDILTGGTPWSLPAIIVRGSGTAAICWMGIGAERALRSRWRASRVRVVQRLALSLVIVAAIGAAFALVDAAAHVGTSAPTSTTHGLVHEVIGAVVVFCLMISLGSVLRRLRSLRREAAFDRRMQCEIQLAERARVRADLRMGEAMLHPSTLAVTIRSAIADLTTDPTRATRTLVSVSEILREAIGAGQQDDVLLSEEREFIDRFFATVATPDVIRWDIEAQCADRLLSRLVLWSLVVTGPGVAHSVRRTVRVRSADGAMILDVNWQAGGAEPLSRLGLACITALADRIRLMYGPSAYVAMHVDDTWCHVRFRMPDTDDSPVAHTLAADRLRTALPRWKMRSQPRVLLAGLLLWLAVTTNGVRAFERVAQERLEQVPGFLSRVSLAGWRGIGIFVGTLLVLWAARVAPFGLPTRRWRAWVVHPCALLMTIVLVLTARSVEPMLFGRGILDVADAFMDRRDLLRATGISIAFVMLSLAAHADVYATRRSWAVVRWRALRRHRAVVRSARRDAELRALSAELAPHFVGNALHGALAVATIDPAESRRLLQSLLLLAERVADRVGVHEISLDEELQELEPFLEIERARLGGGPGTLTVHLDVAPALRRLSVPRFILQPLIENAVRHGIVPSGRAGHIVIRAFAEGSARLVIEIEDDGIGPAPREPGRSSSDGMGRGTGTRVICGRLASMYGPRARFSLSAGARGGAVARLELPVSGT